MSDEAPPSTAMSWGYRENSTVGLVGSPSRFTNMPMPGSRGPVPVTMRNSSGVGETIKGLRETTPPGFEGDTFRPWPAAGEAARAGDSTAAGWAARDGAASGGGTGRGLL